MRGFEQGTKEAYKGRRRTWLTFAQDILSTAMLVPYFRTTTIPSALPTEDGVRV